MIERTSARKSTTRMKMGITATEITTAARTNTRSCTARAICEDMRTRLIAGDVEAHTLKEQKVPGRLGPLASRDPFSELIPVIRRDPFPRFLRYFLRSGVWYAT